MNGCSTLRNHFAPTNVPLSTPSKTSSELPCSTPWLTTKIRGFLTWIPWGRNFLPAGQSSMINRRARALDVVGRHEANILERLDEGRRLVRERHRKQRALVRTALVEGRPQAPGRDHGLRRPTRARRPPDELNEALPASWRQFFEVGASPKK